MFGKKLSKTIKGVVSLSAVMSLFVTGIIPAGAISTNDSVKSTKAEQKPAYRNVMYYGDWSIWEGQKMFMPKDIPADKLTHLNFAFMDFDAQGNLQFTDTDAAIGHPVGQEGVTYNDVNGGILNAFKVLKYENPNLKIGISLGGWSKSGDFTAVCKNSTARANFVKNICAFIKYTDMDFVDVDWEYPGSQREPDLCDNRRDEGTKQGGPEDKALYIQLLKDFRTALDKQGKDLGKTYELSVALPAPIQKVKDGIDVKELFNVVDFANIMTYDMRGAWDKISGHHSALYRNKYDKYENSGLSVDESVSYYLSQGAPSEKVVIGAAYYTRGWEKVINDNTDPNCPGLFGEAIVCAQDADFAKTPGALPEAPLKDGEGGRRTGTWSYNSMDKLKETYPGMKEYWDNQSKVPYLYNEKTGAFFTYDNARSIEEKVKYVKEKNLGGMIAWMASNDKETTSSKRDELTNATYNALYGKTELPHDYIKKPTHNLDVKVSTGAAMFGSGGTLTITVTNNEKLVEQGEVLKSVELASKSLINAKLYVETDGFTIDGSEYPTPVVKEENGYYTMDLGGLFEGKIWRPGASRTYTLKTSKKLENTDGLVKVFLTERMYPASGEMSKQTLVGDNADEEKVVNGNYLPMIFGVRNQKVTVGESFDAMKGITCFDKEDGDLTSKVKVSGDINIRKPGVYELTYTVTDSKGGVRTAKSKVRVRYPVIIEPDNYDPTKTYVTGDIVVYKGHRYELIWHTGNGVLPGTNNLIWKDLGPAEVEVPPVDPDIVDLARVAACYNLKKGDFGFDGECDRNNDGIIDIYDIVSVARAMK